MEPARTRTRGWLKVALCLLGVFVWKGTSACEIPQKVPAGNITVIAKDNSVNSLQVSWTQPPGNVGSYVITLQGALNATQNSTSAGNVTFQGLLPGSSYNITITTVNGDCNQTSDPVTTATYPSKPGALNLIQVGTDSISLNWSEPENMTQAQYYFNITYTPPPGASVPLSNTSSANLTNLTAGTKYTITVVTVGALGYQSLPVNITQYTKPERIPAVNITVIAKDNSVNSLQVSWTQPPGNVETYVIALQGAVITTQNSTSAGNVTFQGLLPGRNYSVTITTVSGDQNQTSDPVISATYPSKPGALNLIQVGTYSMSLNWSEPENMTQAQYYFNITYTSPSGASMLQSNTSSANLTNLTAGTKYTITVVTVGAFGYQSLPVNITQYTKPEKIPASNISVIAKDNSVNSLQVFWSQPPGNVETYVINVQGAVNAVNATQNSTSAGNVTFQGLLPGRKYNVTITTISGDQNQTSDPVISATYPSKPGAFYWTQVGTGSISLNWSDPVNMTGAQYSFNINYTPPPGASALSNTSSANLTNLTAGTNYTITVVTVGALAYQSLPASISLYTKPKKIDVGNITVIANNNSVNSLQVSWTQPPGNVETYVITLQGAVIATQNSTSAGNVTFQGLLPGRNYSVTITTISGDQNQTSDPVINATYPSIPGAFYWTQVATDSISLNWSEPENMTGAQYSFNITYTSPQGASVLQSNISSANLTNLTAGTNYTITVVTVGALGYQSLPASISLYTKPNKKDVGNIIVIANNNSVNSLQVFWTQPPGNVETYVITLQGAVNTTQKSTSAGNVTFPGLLPGRNYSVTITTISGDQNQTSDPVINATYPSKPGTLNLIQVGTDSMSLNWSEPENMTQGLYFFNIIYTSPSRASVFQSNTSSANLTNLTAGTKYTITVVTVGALGYQSLPVNITRYTIPKKIDVGNITVIANNNSVNSLQVSWTQPPGNVETYVITLQGAVNTAQNSTSAGNVTFQGLLPGRNYSVTITTISGNQNQTSDPVINATYPSKPGTLNLIQVATDSISLNWSEPENMTQGLYFFNIIYTSPSRASVFQSNTSSANLTNLTAGTKYTITVVTVGALGYQSLPVNITRYTIPKKIDVGNITVIANNNSVNSLQVSWTQPPGNVETYVITLQGAVNTAQNSTSAGNVTFQGLLPGRKYSVTITTISGNQNQTSDPVINATYPSKPGALNLTQVGTNSMSLSWSEPVNMTRGLYSFNITYTPPSWASVPLSNTSSANLTNLTAGTKYTITVVTVGALGYQSLPVSISLYTKPEKIPAGNITVIAKNNSVNALQVSWTQPPGNVETYVIALQGAVNSTQISKSAGNVTFQGLLPGRNYSVTITTISGDQNQTSDSVINATYPSKPGALYLVAVGTDSMTLDWSEPENMTRGLYYFNITYTPPSATYAVLSNVSSVNLTNLIAGTKYTMVVVTVGNLQYQSSFQSMTSYTKPERIPADNLSVIANNNSVNSLQVSWTQPPGNVETYVITLQGAVNTTQNSTSAGNVTFPGLLPGRTYSVTITTVSGDCSQTSAPVINATYPSQPGVLMKDRIKAETNQISLQWDEPINMSTVEYSFNITYSNSSGLPVWLINTAASASLENLRSGTLYDITVMTVGALGYLSFPVTVSLYTKPEEPKNLQLVKVTNRSVVLGWDQPDEYSSTYTYRVETQGDVSSNMTSKKETAEIDALNPGQRYLFSVFTKAKDGTEGANVSLPVCTDADPVSQLSCAPVNGTPSLTVWWACPPGSNTGLRILIRSDTWSNETEVSACTSGNQSWAPINLNYFTSYTINVTTLSCGNGSVPVQAANCLTSITSPPAPQLIPTVKADSQNTLQVDFSDFNATNGLIKAYAVIVTTDASGLKPPTGILGKTYSDFMNKTTNAYVTYVLQPSRARSSKQAGSMTVTIGDESKTHGYYNGKLEPKSTYWVSVAGFTQITFDSVNDIIIEDQSLVTYSNYSEGVSPPNNIVGPVVGGVVGSVTGAAVLIAAGLLIRRKRRQQGKNENLPFSPVKATKSKAIKLNEFESYFTKQIANANYGFFEEYENLRPVGISQLKSEAGIAENKEKNRYNNVLPYDISRVQLSFESQETDDYINANYMPGYNSKKEFIATQGPLPHTVPDFWRMVWEKNVFAVVMLTKCVEQGKTKCHEYWPTGESKTYGDTVVAMSSESVLPEWTIRDFSLRNRRTTETHPVRQFHFTAWPDHGVPKTTDTLIHFRSLVREYMKPYPSGSPILVHCSAGVGRTGAFIAIDHIIHQVELENYVDVFGIVHDLRMHRPLMVQTESQYIFLHQCALDLIKTKSETQGNLIYENTDAVGIYEDWPPDLIRANGYKV
ncbi:receptor-type tyrosine-protein phosphatase eta-like [Rhinatrema bivittatum]|uniref:receptor-type tyrosine-protein phosphatase eta-like n=1 Tax=Rhinatrema bivittatum TaxID=194408 RepID=UPI00112D1A69|nr:receptor-type tyrosine-protein phosphatase eta-like [Rhinatrema bivittatum]